MWTIIYKYVIISRHVTKVLEAHAYLDDRVKPPLPGEGFARLGFVNKLASRQDKVRSFISGGWLHLICSFQFLSRLEGPNKNILKNL